MVTLPSHDVGQLAVRAAIQTADSVDQLILNLTTIEPLIQRSWERGQTKVIPVALMTEDDLVQ